MSSERCLCESTEGDNPQCRLHPQPMSGDELLDRMRSEKILATSMKPEPQPQHSKPKRVGPPSLLRDEIERELREQPPATDDAYCFRCGKDADECKCEFPPAPATDDKQWTVEPCVGSISGQEWPGLSYIRVGNHTMGSVNSEVAKAIVDAHNAALNAAENAEVQRLRDLAMEIHELKRQLATEREKHESIEALSRGRMQQIERHQQELIELRQQLLFAQAAIAEHNNFGLCRAEINIDLSALDKYVAEKTQPLVELLLEIRELMPDWTMKDLKHRIDALAKVKK